MMNAICQLAPCLSIKQPNNAMLALSAPSLTGQAQVVEAKPLVVPPVIFELQAGDIIV